MTLDLTDFIAKHPTTAYQEALKHLRLQLITDALNLCNQNQSKAAILLGVSRITLKTWMDDYGI